ncbi:ZrgA family zinc uptake protein, partial [Glaciimonas sp. CA11.2]|uniref:ZrgA family zinc uptake protein n=1 Tax=Glaciimonas sp. CA11.2 TaxID=3048601 RepID=UPI002B236244
MQHCCTINIPANLVDIESKNMKDNMKHIFSSVAISALLCLALSPAIAHEAHVHGVGKLDVAIDGAQITLHLDTPLINLLGFEH